MRIPILIFGTLFAGAAFGASINRTHETILLAELNQGTSTVRFEQIKDKAILVTERSIDGNGSLLTPLIDYASSKSIRLCPAQMFGLLSDEPIPKVLWRACPNPEAAKQLQSLRVDPKAKSKFLITITPMPRYCDSDYGYLRFREWQCGAQYLSLMNITEGFDDTSFWCAHILHKSSNRVMSTQLGDEGEWASIRAVSCEGNTRFRSYTRDSTDEPWSLWTDQMLGPSEYTGQSLYDFDAFGDVDIRFRLDSGTGAWHRDTGYFIDE